MLTASDLVVEPALVLSRPAEPVARFDEELRALAREMLLVLPSLNGVGLAAPQIGIGSRLFVVVAAGVQDAYTNPRIVARSNPYHPVEGCLSVPGRLHTPLRHQQITATWQDLDGTFREGRFEGLLAEIFEHETDHLDGILLHQRPQS
jgi:peptide deformylase